MELDTANVLLCALLLLAALLYSSVGHAGASGYLAVMALAGISPAIMRPTALALNIVVAVIATYKFYRAGSFSWRLFAPLAVAAVPLAFLGGRLTLTTHFYKPLVGVILLYAAARAFMTAKSASLFELVKPSPAVLVVAGAAIGFLSGLTGVGGGIFLSPMLLFFRWAPVKVISGVSAAFILVNSIAGLLGTSGTTARLHPDLPAWIIAVTVGGLIGAEYGSKRLGNPVVQRLLALVLAVAGLKMIATA